jgi:hypothetical protein
VSDDDDEKTRTNMLVLNGLKTALPLGSARDDIEYDE